MKDITHITQKFYKNEEERLRKLYGKREVIQSVGSALRETIQKLFTWKIRFMVFETDEDASPPIMYAGLMYCCGEKEYDNVNLNIRLDLEREIKEKTIYQQIIWEI